VIFTCGDILEIKHAIARGDAVVDESIYAKSTRMVKKLIGGADVYLIRENMCTLIDVASPKIESFRIEAHDVPSVNGFCLLDRWGPSAMQEATYHGRPIDFVQAIHWWFVKTEAANGNERARHQRISPSITKARRNRDRD